MPFVYYNNAVSRKTKYDRGLQQDINTPDIIRDFLQYKHLISTEDT